MNKLTELGVVLERNTLKVAVLLESKLSPKSKNPCIRNYTPVRKDLPHGEGGGLLIFIPPASSCTNGYQSSIEHLLTTPETLIIGDFNHPSWYSRSTDTIRRKMADLINGSDYGILNWGSPTRVPLNAEPSPPNISLASASLFTSCSWQTLLTLSSDHLTILIRLQMRTPSKPGLRRAYVNLKKDNWDRYRHEVGAALSKRYFPTDYKRDNNIFRTVLLKAALHHIPTGQHKPHEEPVPAENNMNRRDDLRKRNAISSELPRSNKDIQNRICVHKRQKMVRLC